MGKTWIRFQLVAPKMSRSDTTKGRQCRRVMLQFLKSHKLPELSTLKDLSIPEIMILKYYLFIPEADVPLYAALSIRN